MESNVLHTKVMPMEHSHVNAVVDIHLASFPGFFLTFLGRKFLTVYYQGIVRTTDGIGLISMGENGVEGFVTGFINPQGFYKRFLKNDWLRFCMAALPALFRKPRIAFRLLRAFRKPSGVPRGEAVELSSLAVAPGRQCKGIGRSLVTAFLLEAEKKSASYVYLTTDALDNEQVNKFYTQRGFLLTGTCLTPEQRQMCEYRYILTKRKSR